MYVKAAPALAVSVTSTLQLLLPNSDKTYFFPYERYTEVHATLVNYSLGIFVWIIKNGSGYSWNYLYQLIRNRSGVFWDKVKYSRGLSYVGL